MMDDWSDQTAAEEELRGLVVGILEARGIYDEQEQARGYVFVEVNPDQDGDNQSGIEDETTFEEAIEGKIGPLRYRLVEWLEAQSVPVNEVLLQYVDLEKPVCRISRAQCPGEKFTDFELVQIAVKFFEEVGLAKKHESNAPTPEIE